MLTIKEADNFMNQAKALGSILGLDSITMLLKYLDNPQEKTPCIHVTGTNGKGSTISFLSAILMECGYRVACFTSPAVFHERERYTCNGIWITQEEYLTYLQVIQQASARMVREHGTHPTVFEIETALAFLYFENKQCDLAIVEVGMGGAGDATNVLTSNICSVFTSIGMDHMQFLGDTLEQITQQKAGIMKAGCPAVSIWQEPQVISTLQEHAHRLSCKLTVADKSAVEVISQIPLTFSYQEYEKVCPTLLGSFQLENAVLACTVVQVLVALGYNCPKDRVLSGITKASWPGRMECISRAPEIYLDGAHNVPAALRLRETLELYFTNRRITYIIGVLKDKEYEKVLDILMDFPEDVIVVQPNNVRALDGSVLYQAVHARCENVLLAESMKEAAEAILTKSRDVVIAFGSLSYLKEIKEALLHGIEDENV